SCFSKSYKLPILSVNSKKCRLTAAFMHNSYHFIQIFPDPVESFQRSETSLNSLDHNHQKERLPSIVVEPTELSEVESGELRWPPENLDMEDDEEDLSLFRSPCKETSDMNCVSRKKIKMQPISF
uniref:LBH domain-containing protein n=1 Tax=Oryzias latipes TaxID=8090 RepID=A0A3P9IF13_ORYLA